MGAGAVALSGYYNVPLRVEVLEGNFPVNAGALDLTDINSHNSPTVAANPRDARNIAIANRIDTPLFSCALHVSLDGGATWEQTGIPVPAGEEPKCYAPDVAFSTDGSMHLSYVTLAGLGNRPHAVWMVTSEDGGKTLSDPVRALGPLSFQVRIVADTKVPDRIYMTWLEAQDTGTYAFPEPGYPIMFKSSDDGGRTWSDPVRISDPDRLRVVAGSPAIGPDGTLYVAYLDLLDDVLDYAGAHQGNGGQPYDGPWQLVMARSGDGGATWTESVIEPELVPSERIVVFLPDFPSVAADRDGVVYAAFHDAALGDADVWLWKSEDGGRTWSRGARVNDTGEGDGTTQNLPKLGVAPDGRLDVVYYDRRADPDDVMTDVSLQSSTDGGKSFTSRRSLSDTPFSSGIGYGSERDLADLGSRIGLLSQATRTLAVWSDTRAGTVASGKQDLVRAIAVFSDTRPISDGAEAGLRYGGLAAAVLGVLLLGSWLVGRRPRGAPA